jgi:hypothetical protein
MAISSIVKVVEQQKMGTQGRRRATNILQFMDNGKWWLGRMQKMRRKVGSKWFPS